MSENLIAVHAIGRDQPGVIAALTNALTPLAVYHDDPRTSLIPGGNFMVLIVLRTDVTVHAVRRAVQPVSYPDVIINVWELEDHTSDKSEPADRAALGDPLVLRIHAQGRPGIIAAFTKVVAQHGGIIHDFGTRIGGGRISVLRVELPGRTPEMVSALEHDLFHLGELTGIGIKLYDPAQGENEPMYPVA